MDEALLRKCDNMMKGLMKRTQAVHFSKPVDWKKMGLHEYPRIVKQPMDLGTAQDRLTRQHYGRLEEFANDIRLVWGRRCHRVTFVRTIAARARALRRLDRQSPDARGNSAAASQWLAARRRPRTGLPWVRMGPPL